MQGKIFYKLTIFIVVYFNIYVDNFYAQQTCLEDSLNAFTKDFSTYPTFPITCFKNIFTDESGKLWITNCDDSIEDTSVLYTFDGYSFKTITPANLKNLYAYDYHGIKDDKFFGTYQKAGSTVLFFYNLRNNQITPYDSIVYPHPPDKNGFVQQRITQKGIYTYVFKQDSVQLITHDRDLNKTTYPQIALKRIKPKAPMDKVLEYYSFAYHEEWLTFYDETTNVFKFLNLKTQELVTQTNPLFDKKILTHRKSLSTLKSSSVLKLNTTEGLLTTHIKVHNSKPDSTTFEVRSVLYESKNRNNLQQYETLRYFEDLKGNLIEYLLEDNDIRMRLISTKGMVYDLSHITSSYSNKYITSIKGDNFMTEFFVCTTRNLYLHKVEPKTFVQSYTTNSSARSIVPSDSDLILVKNQSYTNELSLISQNKLTDSSTLDMCAFRGVMLDRSETDIWGTVDYNLARYNFAEGFCELIDKSPKVKQLRYVGKEMLIILDESYRYWTFNVADHTFAPIMAAGEQLVIKDSFQDFFIDDTGYLWIVCHQGLSRYDFNSQTLTHIKSLAEDFRFNLTSIIQINAEEFLLGTYRSGVLHFNKTDYTYKVIDESQGLSNNMVASITADADGNYWIGTFKGVSVLDKHFKVVGSFYKADGLVNNECNRFSSRLLEDGRIAIGTLTGISIFEPNESIAYLKSLQKPKIYFTNISFFDKSEDKYVSVSNVSSLELSPSDNRLNLEFALSSYIQPHQNTYTYKIEGLDNSWVKLEHRNSLSFNNLAPGTYNIKIRGSDYHNLESSNTLQFQVVVGAYFYEQIWFYVVVFLVIIAFILAWVYTLRVKIKEATYNIEKDKTLIEKQAESLQKLDVAKSVFFTNITHEFRTPLTIINSTLDLLKSYGLERINKEIHTIEYSTKNLLRKINMILDLRKLESEKLNIHNVQTDVISYIQDITDAHQNMALQKGITIKFKSDAEHFVMDFDPEKLEAVVSNLLTNAIKYTPKGGKIKISLRKDTNDDRFLLNIKDTGYGIPKEELRSIFENFYRFKPEGSSQTGTGIGLSLAKKLVELMQGQIEVKSKVNKGTTFTVKLPVSRNAPYHEKPAVRFDVLPAARTDEMTFYENTEPSGDAHSILIVEDNPQLRQLLKAQLNAYQLYIAKDGEEGIALAQEHVPDIIISDVMMPKKDGYELCKAVKNHLATSHIPVILLTAKADQESKLKGLEIKADAYLYKPYDLRELRLILKNLTESRASLQKRLRQLQDLDDENSQNSEDKFIAELRTIITKNLKDDAFGYQDIAEALDVSTAQLYKKLKSLTGMSVGNFILLIRLQEAQKLLSDTDHNIKEITFRIGLNSQSYFSTKFKEEFGMSPSEWRYKYSRVT